MKLHPSFVNTPYLRPKTCEICVSRCICHLALCEMECDALLRFSFLCLSSDCEQLQIACSEWAEIQYVGPSAVWTFFRCVAVRWKFLHPTATGRIVICLSNSSDGQFRSTVWHYGNLRTAQVPRNVSLFIDITCLLDFSLTI